MRRVAAVVLLLSLGTGCGSDKTTAPPDTPPVDPQVVVLSATSVSAVGGKVARAPIPKRVIQDWAVTDGE